MQGAQGPTAPNFLNKMTPSTPLPPYALPAPHDPVVPCFIKVTPEPTQEEIDLYHARFVSELRRIFEKYKGPYGWGDKELIIS